MRKIYYNGLTSNIAEVQASSAYRKYDSMDTITIMSTDLEENDITTVEEIELKFRIVNSDTYHEIDETDPIAFSVKQ